MEIIYRNIDASEIYRIREIDRSEIINDIYCDRNGALELEQVFCDIKEFSAGEIESIIERQTNLLKKGGMLIGAFAHDKLAGVASVENKIRGTNGKYIKMDILYVSKKYRRRGIAGKLLELARSGAKALGGEKLYISATPSKNTVEFYMNNGARRVEELDEELFALEPEDIHLELSL